LEAVDGLKRWGFSMGLRDLEADGSGDPSPSKMDFELFFADVFADLTAGLGSPALGTP